MDWLKSFVAESNRIEGITRAPTKKEVAAHARVLSRPAIFIDDLSGFVQSVAPGHTLRDKVGLNVRVGRHIAPAGGPDVPVRLEAILRNITLANPYRIHCDYELLHPFTDGNGRSGRALWLWQMLQIGGRGFNQAKALGFLHTFYYQTLSEQRLPTPPAEVA